LMVENITPQLGDFFGVKNGKGVLVRSVEKGSRAEKAGFHAGDVVVKVNDQVVHDTSDFTHALRSSSAGTAAVTVIRDKREQSITLTLPPRKDSGRLQEDDLDIDVDGLLDDDLDIDVGDVGGLAVETERGVSRIGDEIVAKVGPLMEKVQRQINWKDLQKQLEDTQRKLHDQQERLRHELKGEWTEL